jgi:hypothetical protein
MSVIICKVLERNNDCTNAYSVNKSIVLKNENLLCKAFSYHNNRYRNKHKPIKGSEK